MKTKRCSLKFRLLKILVLPIIIAFLSIGIASYYSAYHEAEEIYDAQLANFAKILNSLTKYEIEHSNIISKKIAVISHNLGLHEYEKNFAYRIWVDGKLILYSSNADNFGSVTQSTGFTDRMIGEGHWRLFVLNDDKVTIEVAERYEIREDLIEHIIGGIFFPHLLIIPALGLIIWFGISQGVKPLNFLSDIIRNRDANNLEPIEAPIIPVEISPILDAINDLMQKTASVLEHEKQFSNYVAHELRTPLAALKTQLQVAIRTKDNKKAKQLFAETLPVVKRMQNLIDKLLTFARIQCSDNSIFETVNISKICSEIARETAERTSSNKDYRILECNIEPDITIYGNSEMLQALLHNLINNAIKYTETGGKINIRLEKEDNNDKIRLSVADDGIGISESHKSKLFDNFYRVANNRAEGSGLGLAIVKWVADAHNASIEITDGIGGNSDKGSCFCIIFNKVENSNKLIKKNKRLYPMSACSQ